MQSDESNIGSHLAELGIKIVAKNYRCFTVTEPFEFELAKGYTAFVGLNNSGKTAILRFFYEIRPMLEALMTNDKPVELLKHNWGLDISWSNKGINPNDLMNADNDENMAVSIEIDEGESQDRVTELTKVEFQILRSDWAVNKCYVSYYSKGERYNLKEEQAYFNSRDGLITTGGQNPTSLASLRRLSEAIAVITSMVYIPAYRHAIGATEGRSSYYDITIGPGFIQTWVNASGSDNLSARNVHKVVEDIRNLLGLDIFNITINSNPFDLRVNINGRSIVLGEIGDGISQLLIVLLSVKLTKPSFCLIDEPELNLHPRLQIEFLRLLNSYTHYGVMFSTHSYGLARVFQAEGRMISMTKRAESSPPTLDYFEHPDLLRMLYDEFGYSGLADIGSAVLLLVEGVNDVLVVKHWLQLIDPHEEVLVIPLGGSNIICRKRSEEIKVFPKITHLCYCLIDRDGADGSSMPEEGREDFLKLCEVNSICAHMTKRRALENYFTDSALRKVFPHNPSIAQLQEFEQLTVKNNCKPTHWQKALNLQIARQMTLNDLEGTDILDFLECVIRRKKYTAK